MGLEFYVGPTIQTITSQVQACFDSVYSTSYFTYSSTGGVNNGPSIKTGHSYAYSIKNVTAGTTKTIGLHIRGAGTGYSSSNNYSIATFIGPDIRIYNTTSGFDIRRGTTQIYLASGVFLTSDLTHIQIKVYSHATEGYVQIKLNGSDSYSVNATGLNTGGQNITSILFGSSYSSNAYYSNINITDTFYGEMLSTTLYPYSDYSVQFTPSVAGNNYEMITELTPDGDNSYVSSSTPGNKDLYTYDELPFEYSPVAVSLYTMARKTNIGDKQLKNIVFFNTVTYDLTSKTLSLEYPGTISSGVADFLSLAPDGTPWTNEKFNSCKWGFEDV